MERLLSWSAAHGIGEAVPRRAGPGGYARRHRGMKQYLYVGAVLGLTIYGQLIMKWRALVHAQPGPGRRQDYLLAMYTDIRVLSGLAAAFVASVFWSLAIERMPLSAAYPFMALSFALVPIASVLLFRDSLSLVQLLGILLIVVGVPLSALGR